MTSFVVVFPVSIIFITAEMGNGPSKTQSTGTSNLYWIPDG
jgi:hypothetical protein